MVGLLKEHWGSARIVTRGNLHKAEALPGFVAEQEGERIGLVTFRNDDRDCEIVSLNSLVEKQGVGSALLEAVGEAVKTAGCRRIWLISTNDNLAALRFYQMKGLRLVAVYKDAVEKAHRLKPEIPEVGYFGIPIRDEIELELELGER